MARRQLPPDLDITIVSAKDLKNVNWKHGDLCAYAVAWVDPAVKVTTRVDDEGDTDPEWGEKFTLSVTRELREAVLTVEIYHDKASDPKKALVGHVTLSLHELADAGGFDETRDYSLKLRRPSGRPHGKIQLGARLRVKVPAPSSYPTPAPYGQNYYAPPGANRDYQAYPGYSQYAPPYAQAPVPTAYAQPYAAPSYAYGPPQPSYGAPQYSAYGESAQYSQPAGSSAYGMQQPQQVAPKTGGKFGGMGAGLAVGALGGALGGLALGEYVQHEENEAAEHQAEVDADRYDDQQAAQDDYGGGDNYGDDFGGNYGDDY